MLKIVYPPTLEEKESLKTKNNLQLPFQEESPKDSPAPKTPETVETSGNREDENLLTVEDWKAEADRFSEKTYSRLSPGLRPWLAENCPETLARIHHVEAKLDSMRQCALSELIETLREWQTLHLEGETMRKENKKTWTLTKPTV